jgi:hypothetical protein
MILLRHSSRRETVIRLPVAPRPPIAVFMLPNPTSGVIQVLFAVPLIVV